MHPPLPKEAREKIRVRYSQGCTQKQVAEEIGCSQFAVYKALRDDGVPMRGVPGDWLTVQEAMDVCQCSQKVIYRLGKEGVLTLLDAEDIPPASRNPWAKLYVARGEVEAVRLQMEGAQQSDEEWMTVPSASRYLGFTRGALPFRITRGALIPVHWTCVPPEQRVARARHYLSRSQLDTFKETLYYSRVRTVPTHHELIDLVYMASFIDCEGCIRLTRHHQGGTPGYYPSIVASNTNEGIMRWIEATFGGYLHCRRFARQEWKDSWVWRVNSGAAYQLARLIRPYLRIKERQAELIVEYYERVLERRDAHDHRVSVEEGLWRETIMAQLLSLNAKGKPR